ncbi:IdgA domain protein [Metarhizium album ARSEF 1941]|uniref:IdgA domain protein n=1 Tax=Metarhizium album (strain ARSEF 1941) TaxID=1081103 RepID=A0A0B2X414_METAS|nr:IdgA domain protein [Metarhizium album ARSEF 1941]KHO00051.1 IdgA domain protein [Metarhizium album ARSEF 1941]
MRRRGFASNASSNTSLALGDWLRVSDEVADAVAENKPVVALESTIYTHGALSKDLPLEHEDLVRSLGGIPAIVAIVDGVPTVGVSGKEMIRVVESGNAAKVSRRDISYLVGMGIAGRRMHGGTTISGTMLLARLAGIRVFGTGGLGGVHRGGENSMDISADLTELGRTRVAVISSGCKGFLDIPRTLEYLETQGCVVSTFADGRHGKIDFPAFWARDSGVKSPLVVDTEKEAASMILAQERLGIESGLLFANPIPEKFAVPSDEMHAAIEQALTEANEKGFTGNTNTPYILQRLRELCGGKVVSANKNLATANITRATNIAVELSRLLANEPRPATSSEKTVMPPPRRVFHITQDSAKSKADVLVAGGVAIDLSCDYTGSKSGHASPQAHTSNPASITQSIGGVGHNVALAARLASTRTKVSLCSMVADDIAGATVISSLQQSGLDTTHVKRLQSAEHTGSRTAQYIAVNDANRNLVVAMADMGIFTQYAFPEEWRSTVKAASPKWLVVDGNWGASSVREWVRIGKEHRAKVAFEPVSVAKSKGLFTSQRGIPKLGIFPHASVDMASPNTYELAGMYEAAKENGHLDSQDWFKVIDAFGMTGARDRFVRLTSAELTDAGVPVQCVNLLPYVPTLLTKLGPNGVLLTAILGRDDPRLRDRDAEEYILARASPNHPTVGGIYMRLFPPVEKVEKIVSVNGVGDTFLGVLISGLALGGSVERLIDVAQKGAVLTLKSHRSVSPKLMTLEDGLVKAMS